MTLLDLARGLGGLGLFLFALRFMTGRLNRSVAARFRPFLNRLMGTPTKALACGTMTTGIVQSSNITIVSAMGLLDSALITLEQAFFVMLGAALGATVTAWAFVGAVHYGPLLVAAGSLPLVFARNLLTRELLQLVTAVGLAFIGLDMMTSSLAWIPQQAEVAEMIRAYDSGSFGSLLLALLVGALLTVALQSDSAMVVLVMGLTAQGTISFTTAVAVVLGANLGITSTALIAALQSEAGGRRLALAHFFTKLGGVVITLLLLPSFLGAIEGLTHLVVDSPNAKTMLASVHTGFNFLNLVFWSLLSGIVLRSVSRMVPSSAGERLGLTKGVRRMLGASRERALKEVQSQFRQLELLVKNLYDHTFLSLTQGSHHPGLRSRRVWLERNIEYLKETLHDLLFSVFRHEPEGLRKMLPTLSMIEVYSSLTRTCFAFHDHLERGFVVDRYVIPGKVHDGVSRFRTLLDHLWLEVLLPDKVSEDLSAHPSLEETLEEIVLRQGAEREEVNQEYLTWLLEIAGFMRVLGSSLGELSQLKHRQGMVFPMHSEEHEHIELAAEAPAPLQLREADQSA